MSLKSLTLFRAVVGESELVAYYLVLVCLPVKRDQKGHAYMYIFNLMLCLLGLVLVHLFEKLRFLAFSLKVFNDHLLYGH